MSKEAGNVEAEGRASELDMGHREIVWVDVKGMITMLLVMPQVETLPDNYALLKNQQRRLPWRVHQSEVVEKYGSVVGKIAQEKS
jgi:hypothetical protein